MQLTGSAPPVRGVVLDLHSTLVNGGDPQTWLEAAWRELGRPGRAMDGLGASAAEAVTFLDRIWEHARDVDPDSAGDLDPQRHREVFDRTMERLPGIDPALADALYRTMAAQWEPYNDAVPILDALRTAGIRVVILSNVGFDLTPTLARTGLAERVDGVVMSFVVGVVKPAPEIFERALGLLGLTAPEVLMVGDSWPDDGGATALGIRTLLLPRTEGPVRGLELVLRLVNA